jgi:hypothetical protein
MNSYDSEYQVSASESEDPEGSQGEETDELDAPVDGFSHPTASDWKRVAAFESQITAHHPKFDSKYQGRLRRNISMSPCDIFLLSSPWR